MLDVGGQISDLPKLRDVLLCDRGGHPPAVKVGSGHDRRSEELSLSLGCWNSRWGKGRIEREKKRTGLGPFIERVNIKRPPRGRLELA